MKNNIEKIKEELHKQIKHRYSKYYKEIADTLINDIPEEEYFPKFITASIHIQDEEDLKYFINNSPKYRNCNISRVFLKKDRKENREEITLRLFFTYLEDKYQRLIFKEESKKNIQSEIDDYKEKIKILNSKLQKVNKIK